MLALVYLSGLLSACFVQAVTFQPLPDKPGLIDNGTFGPDLEVVHLFTNEAPIGITVGPTGRAFVTFNRFAYLFCLSSSSTIPYRSLIISTFAVATWPRCP